MPGCADEIALGVIVGLPLEAATLTAARLDRDAVIVAGIGRERARAAATKMIERGAHSLLSFGVCGGLSPRLRAGDLVLPRRVAAEPGEWMTGDALRARLLEVCNGTHEVDVLYCSDTPVISVGHKRELADRGFAAVDMESSGVAEAASQAGVPFIAVKAICDPAEHAIPALALRMLDSHGRLRASAMFEAARAGPRVWRELRALRADLADARASLRQAARTLPSLAEGVGS
jgi:adenosylhomocysteine nucleosidase